MLIKERHLHQIFYSTLKVARFCIDQLQTVNSNNWEGYQLVSTIVNRFELMMDFLV